MLPSRGDFMIVSEMFDLFVYLVKKLSYNDFVMTFSYIAILVLLVKAYRGLLHVD